MSPAAEAPPDRLAAAGVAGGWLVLALAVLAGLPSVAEWPGTGLDPSWKLAFHLCRERGLVVGRDTLYTYGPWGFLASPMVLVGSQWLASVAWLVGGHLAAATLVVPGAGLPRPARAAGLRLAEVAGALRHFRQPAGREEGRERLRRLLPLGPDVRAELEGRTVDVVTHELAVVEAYDFAWRPRPVLQSFLACTARLDRRDADFLVSDRAPERLLVELFGLDTRDPLADTPLTWRALALHWEPVARDRRWLVLERRQVPRTVAASSLARFEVDLNRPFRLPDPERGHLELTLRLEPSVAGRLVAALWKTPEVRLQVVAPDVHPGRRVVTATAVNPFPLVDPPVSGPADLAALLLEPSVGSPRIARLVCRAPWAWVPASVEVFWTEWLDVGLREGESGPRL